MNGLLTVHGLQKRFQDQTILDIDTLCIQPASAYVLTGPNGTGKSTLLRILGGLEPANLAGAFFLEQKVSFFPYSGLLRRSVVYVHQHPILFNTTVAANIGYGLKARGASEKEIQDKVVQAMHWAGVMHLKNHPPSALSGGEKQRIALARAKVLEPKLLLLDEPTSSLDGAARTQVIELIPALVTSGSTVIMACHDKDLIALPGTQRLHLQHGRLAYAPDYRFEPPGRRKVIAISR
jgi:tungstate transport system ATP-binding protein